MESIGQVSSFSLLMSVYRGSKADELERCLASVERQDAMPTQTVVVRDGPIEDSVAQVLAGYRRRLRVLDVILEENAGLGVALASGLARCSCELVARMDTDDVCAPGRFGKQLRFLGARPDIAVLGGVQREFRKGTRAYTDRRLPTDPDLLRTFAKMRNPLNHPSVMFRRQAVVRAGGYRPFHYLEDYDLWVRVILSGGRIANLPDVLVESEIDDSMYSRRGGLGYVGSEWRLAAEFRRRGFHTRRESAMFLMSRIPMRLLSRRYRSAVYRRLLRDRET